ncbi:unnamed protein product [Linum trigynum]|uniref:Uncharacterized protein n=1 Tax=Linum trigynum TaxID=586398 RepID=A0AAV2FCU1_9ROSI
MITKTLAKVNNKELDMGRVSATKLVGFVVLILFFLVVATNIALLPAVANRLSGAGVAAKSLPDGADSVPGESFPSVAATADEALLANSTGAAAVSNRTMKN